jgi:hypothetical protein
MESAEGSSSTLNPDPDSVGGVGGNVGVVMGTGVAITEEHASSNAKSATKSPVTNRRCSAFVGITDI